MDDIATEGGEGGEWRSRGGERRSTGMVEVGDDGVEALPEE